MQSDSLHPMTWDPSNAITANVLLDHLGDLTVVSKPPSLRRSISWCTVPLGSDESTPFEDARIVYLLHLDNVEREMRRHPHSVGLLVLREDEPFDENDPPFDRAILHRVVVVRASSSCQLVALQSRILLMLYTLVQWTDALQAIIDGNGSMQDLVDASEKTLGCFLDVSDASFTLIAHSTSIEPPDQLSRRLVETGHHTLTAVERAEDIGAVREWRGQKGVEIFEDDAYVAFPYATYVMRTEGVYSGHVVMVCNDGTLTPGRVDLFAAFASACQKLMEKNVRSGKATARYHAFFENLVNDASRNQAYLDEQAAMIGLDPNAAFCLALVDHSASEYSEQPSYLASLLGETFGEQSVFLYDGHPVALLYGDGVPALKEFCRRYGCSAFLSDRFDYLGDLGFAYRQASLARKYRPCIDVALAPFEEQDKSERSVFRFEEAFCLFCNDDKERRRSAGLFEFCLSHSPLDAIAQADREHGTNDVKLLYRFLLNERKATPTAEQAHMHRNNVLYRIKAIERRYGLDLDRHETRQRLLACYRIKMLSSMRFRDLLR